MLKSEFVDFLKKTQERMFNKFTEKANGYEQDGDAFFNFRQIAILCRQDESYESLYKELFSLASKHIVTLAKNGLDDSEFVDRTEDIIIYMYIALGLYQAREDQRERGKKINIEFTADNVAFKDGKCSVEGAVLNIVNKLASGGGE
jgi:hypothetical protein